MSDGGFAAFVAASVVVSLLVCEIVRRFALSRALLDSPNARSLHVQPTPRLGGVAVIATTAVATFIAIPDLSAESRSLLVGCVALGAVGLRDDIRPLSARTRIIVQLGLACGFLWLVGIPPLELLPGFAPALPAAIVAGALVFWIVAVLNIYNFMDGMDGLAGFQTLSAGCALAVAFGGSDLTRMMTLLAAASLGFLLQNFPPARIFLGDAGSTFIGMMFASVVVLGMRRGVPITASALPLAPFLLDGTFTIVRRALRGEKVWQAHRSHLYQRAVQSGRSHREVLLVYVAWMVATAGAGTIAANNMRIVIVGWLAAVGGLLGVWRWVVKMESERAELA